MELTVRRVGLVLGPLAFLAAVLAAPAPLGGLEDRGPSRALGLALWMAIWWLTEAAPLAWTACLPLVLLPIFPLAGRAPAEELLVVGRSYVDAYVFLFLGGLCLAAAIERWHLHRRLALFVLSRVGTAPPRLLLGVLCATAFVSLWISNTATAAMMLPIALSLVRELEGRAGRRLEAYGCALVLAVAYGANIGGIGTKIGTAPNAQLTSFLESHAGVRISFLEYSAIGLPVVFLLLPVAWSLLWRSGRADAPRDVPDAAYVAAERARLGPWTTGERKVGCIFACTAALWIASAPITAWMRAVGPFPSVRTAHVEAGAALVAAGLLFLLRTDGTPLLRLRSLRSLAWSTLLLLGGSLALAQSVQDGGLSEVLAEKLAVLRDMPPLAALITAALVSVLLSSVASNTATVGVLLGVLWSAAAPGQGVGLVFAATLAASCDFALPAGTPPNALVFGSGYVRVRAMARIGIVLDLAAALIVALWCSFAVHRVL